MMERTASTLLPRDDDDDNADECVVAFFLNIASGTKNRRVFNFASVVVSRAIFIIM